MKPYLKFPSPEEWEEGQRMKKCKFIRTNNEVNSIFVPLVNNSWERHQWLKGYFGKECAVVGEEMWGLLVERHEVKVLVEEDGVFREERPTIGEAVSVQSVKAPSEFMLEYAYEESEE